MNVYWSVYLAGKVVSDLNYFAPENLLKRLNSNRLEVSHSNNFYRCPSVRDITKQIYTLKFPYDYSLTVDRENDRVTSDMYDQNFFDEYVLIRSPKDGFFSIMLKYILLAEGDLEMEATGPYFSENSFAKNVRVIPGRFNVGKWMRTIEVPFFMHSDCNKLTMNRGDDCLYLKFNTSEDINMVKFYATDKIKSIMDGNLVSKTYSTKHTLSHWYELFEESKQKNFLLKEIKDNIMD